MNLTEEIEGRKEVYDLNIHNYLNTHNLLKDKHVLFISSKHFYFYNNEEMKYVNTIVFLKKLNEIEYLYDTIRNLHSILNENTVFCGKFIDNKRINILFMFSKYTKLFDVLSDILYKKYNRPLSLNNVDYCLKKYKFKILNTTEIDGVTYFYAKNYRL